MIHHNVNWTHKTLNHCIDYTSVESQLAIDSDLMATESRLNESEFLRVSESARESSTQWATLSVHRWDTDLVGSARVGLYVGRPLKVKVGVSRGLMEGVGIVGNIGNESSRQGGSRHKDIKWMELK